MEPKSLTARADVTIATSEPRTTPTAPRGAAFRDVLARTAVKSAEGAMRSLPGAPLMAVALRGGAGASTLGVPLTGAGNVRSASPEGPVALGSGGFGSSASASGGSGALGALGVGGSGTGSVGPSGTGAEPGVEASLAQSQELNLYYLQLQEAVNAQNRSFTALSNVLKAEHETVKTAIGNIR